MSKDAVVPCPKCKGDRVVAVDEVLKECPRCKAQGLVPARAFAVPLEREPDDDELAPHELAPWSAHYEPRGAA